MIALLPTPHGRVLDLGTGSGILAMRAMRGGAYKVVATDINPDAIEYAKGFARVNGIRGIDWRHGQDYEPVAYERFHHIYGHAPFMRSSETDYTFADGGVSGHDVLTRWVQRARDHLMPGGLGCFFGVWPVPYPVVPNMRIMRVGEARHGHVVFLEVFN